MLFSLFLDGLESAHHPFTDVHPEDRHMFYKDPSKVTVMEYRVLNVLA